MTAKGTTGKRYGYVFDDNDNEVDASNPDYIQIFKDKLRKKAIAQARENMPKQQYFNENLNYIPHTDDGFKTYSRITEVDTVGKIKFPWDR